MEEFILSNDVIEQIKDFDYYDLTEEQSLLIDKLILNDELRDRCRQYEWIEYDRFENVEYLAKGGFGTIYKAIWKDGSIRSWDSENNKWKRSKYWFREYENFPVVLKCLHNSQDITADFLREIGTHKMILKYIGLCRPANVKPSQNERKELYGVLPYVAPEVLRGKEYTQESDIYGYGIIAYEVCTGLPPYHDIVYDKFLAISICQGLRPKSNYKIPQLILNIIKQCWDADPLKRPKAEELKSLLRDLYYSRENPGNHEIKKQIKEADKINEKLTSSSLLYNGPTLSYTTNPQAVYTSRLLNFKNLPEPKNATDNKVDDNSFGEYSESIEAIDFTKLDLDKSN
ncbi:uncharacterized protein OCT59_027221 [Rhizophagus irregularis]|uniref:uncharacterized protein n=1 Tax=Rhizophagus irregularis TaxID=588596 RepID=UPI00331743DD|nr:hypothetical protein OCT59_027221 [Rhizophagus irregularis]